MSGEKILIVDDEQSMCQYLTIMLQKEGYEVTGVQRGVDALREAKARKFDLVITDIKMRGPSGLEVMKFVNENHPTTRVIVITGFATVETAREALKGGAVDFIPKPFKMSELRDMALRLAAEKTKGEFAQKGN